MMRHKTLQMFSRSFRSGVWGRLCATLSALVIPGLILVSVLLSPTIISAQEQDPVKALPLYELTRNIRDVNPAATGSWHFDLYSEDVLLGDMTVAISVAGCTAGNCYVMDQQGTFLLSATDTRKITSRAVLKPDLTLLEYEKTERGAMEDGLPFSRGMKSVVGGLSVITVSESGGAPEEKQLRKTGPVYLAPAATWLLVRALSPENGVRYTYDAFNPERIELLAASIQVAGAVVSKTESGPEHVFRILAFNGDSSLVFNVDSQGRIVSYGPEDGSMEFRLRK